MTTYADHTPDKAGLPKTADQKEIIVDKSTDIPVMLSSSDLVSILKYVVIFEFI